MSSSLAPTAASPVGDGWTTIVLRDPPDPAAAADAIRVLAPAVNALAWDGEDPLGDRRRALSWFRRAVTALSEARPGLAIVLDWWLVAALGQEPTGGAWSIDREVPGATGEVMRAILEHGLDDVRRPAKLAAGLLRLKDQVQRNSGKIAGEKQILTEAMNEGRAVLRAAERGEAPPSGLRLADPSPASLEAWASQGQLGRRVEPGTPVWGHLVKELQSRAETICEVLAAWPVRGREPVSLPASWREALREVCGPEHDLVSALVADAVAEPGYRPQLALESMLPALARAPADPAVADRLYGLVREVVRCTGAQLPGWAEPVARRVAELDDEISSAESLYRGEAAEQILEARANLTALDLQASADWLRAAAEEHERTAAGADRERRVAVASERARWLASQGGTPPARGGDDAAWARAIDLAWTEARDRLRDKLEGTAAELGFVTGRAEVEPAVNAARLALGRGDLAAATAALARADAEIRQLHARSESQHATSRAARSERLGPVLHAVADRAAGLPDRAGIDEAIARAVERRAAGLDISALTDDLVALVDLLEAKDGRVAAIAVWDPRTGRQSRVAWVLGGVRTSGSESRYRDELGHRLSIGGKEPADALRRAAGWGEVRRGPGATQRWFEPVDDRIVGPYPTDAAMAVASLPIDRFVALFGRIDVEVDRWLVPSPPDLGELLEVGGVAEDRMEAEAAASWIADRLRGGPAAAWESDPRVPEPVRRARLARLTALLGETRALASVRDEAVAAFVASPRGQAAIAGAAAAEVEAEVSRRRAAIDAEIEIQRDRLAALHDEVAAADELLGDRKLRLLGALSGGAPAARGRPSASAPIRAGAFAPTTLPELPALVADLAGHTWDPEAVANLLLSLATGRWTLLAGLPGVGKSTFVRSVLARLGHGPTTDRYLELVVRRDWQDDAALFGFWHPTDGAWTPSSEGFVEHLLRAADDERRGQGGVWPILVEELNLASPEYYLARPISAFESPDATVRLYDPELAPHNAGRYPATFRVPDSVRIVATVNVDDTVERLSPRMLSRASVLWVEARPEAPLWRPTDDVSGHRIAWPALRERLEPRTGDLAALAPLLRFLEDARVPGAPTARTRLAIARYLGAAHGVLEPRIAEDFQVLQRVLPPLRGVGPRWRSLLDELVRILERGGWARSARRAEDLRIRGEELGDWYDFFHT